ncbi:MAG: hypothetical protein JW863_02100 [Chitinispirillaceae bacterium]|nr:hypothetical protein [Chitinispirillaceae bacterium]
MTFNRLFYAATMVLSVCLSCIQNPADHRWTTDESVRISNNYRYLSNIVQSSRGIYYGIYNGTARSFTDSMLAENLVPDTLYSGEYIRYLHIDNNDNLLLLGRYSIFSENQFTANSSFDTAFHGDSSGIAFQPFLTPDNSLLCVTAGETIIIWNDAAFTTFMDVPALSDHSVIGMYTVLDTLHILQCSSRQLFHTVIDTNTKKGYSDTIDVYMTDTIFRIDGKTFLTGFKNPPYNSEPFLFELVTGNRLLIRDTLEYLFPVGLVSEKALFAQHGKMLYKITSHHLYQITLSGDTGGPLFLDRNRRPALFNLATRRIIPLDSLVGFRKTAEW